MYDIKFYKFYYADECLTYVNGKVMLLFAFCVHRRLEQSEISIEYERCFQLKP